MTAGQPATTPLSEGTLSAQRLQGHFDRVDGAYLEGSHARVVGGHFEQRGTLRIAGLDDGEDDGAKPLSRWAEALFMLASAVVVAAIVVGVLWAARLWAVGA